MIQLSICLNRLRLGWAALWLTFPILLLIACSSPPKVVQGVEADQQHESISLSLYGEASVLVTEQADAPSNDIVEVRVNPSSLVVDPTDTMTLSAAAFDASGQQLGGAEFVWAMVDPRAGAITKEGEFTAGLVAGVYEDAVSVTAIQNTPEGIQYVSSIVQVNVIGESAETTLTSVAILPDAPTVLSGQILRMRAVGFDQNGFIIPGVSFSWQVRDPSLGHVNDLGFLTVSGQNGTYSDAVTVTSVWNGIRLSASTDVNVVQTPEEENFLSVQILPKSFQLDQGEKLQLRAIALNGLGRMAENAEFRWFMEDSRAGTISNSGIFFAGSDPGIYTESIKVEAVVFEQGGVARAENFASVVVREQKQARRLESVRVLPQSIAAQRHGRVLLTTQGVDELGKPMDDITISWEALHENVGTIDDKGQFIASNVPGTYPESLRVTIRQSVDGEVVVKSKSIDVTLTGTLAEIEVRPPLATITPGRTVHFSTRAFDENGNPLTGLITKWSVSDDSIGSIDAFGNFTAGDLPGLYKGAIKAEVIQQQTK